MAEPILRWAGSKKKLLSVLSSAAPSTFKRYVEPFVGSAVLFLELDPSKAVLSDINTGLIETYENIRAHPRAVWNRVSDMPLEESFYYDLRSQDADSLKTLDRAARFVYLNRFCFNGVYRTNRQGLFNVSRGKPTMAENSWNCVFPARRPLRPPRTDVTSCAWPTKASLFSAMTSCGLQLSVPRSHGKHKSHCASRAAISTSRNSQRWLPRCAPPTA